jgi:hypothetical protein
MEATTGTVASKPTTKLAETKQDDKQKKGYWLQYLSYLYFLRASIILWLSMPVLAFLDWAGAASFTRGIIALDDWRHFILSAFFITINGWVALLSARIVCAYGGQRFECEPPETWKVTEDDNMSIGTFLVSQLPGLVLLIRVAWISHYEMSVNGAQKWGYASIAGYLLLGVLAALLCWILIAGIYYWMFWNKDPENPDKKPTANKPKSFLAPCSNLFKCLQDREPPLFLLLLSKLGKIPARLGPGYKTSDRPFNPLHTGHALAFLVLSFILTVYFVFWDFTSPVPLKHVHLIVEATILAVGLLVAVATGLYHIRLKRLSKRKHSEGHAMANLCIAIVLFFPIIIVILTPFIFRHNHELMPVLASVSVLLLFIIWGLAAMAFFLDRFRVPVLTSGLLLLALIGRSSSDHLVQTTNESYPRTHDHQSFLSQTNLPTPRDIINNRILDPSNPQPVIIVTATGGGIHAASWTSAVLRVLEEEFKSHGNNLHSNILLMSTVSGGSVGTLPWITEYVKPNAFDPTNVDKMRTIAECSDLQAVAWGLTYADFMRLFIPYSQRDLAQYDRGWSLQQAFWRNRRTACNPKEQLYEKDGKAATEETLGGFVSKDFPAFSFNTTVAETGNRFLLSNYRVPKQIDSGAEIVPASSFLDIYQKDLALSSAARLSANFPYVSPMPRVDMGSTGYHFGDGGYFDNDGTGTAMEFLWFAFIDRNAQARAVPILLLEIRDSPDIDASQEDDDLKHQNDNHSPNKGNSWGTKGQLTGPLLAFWNSGHVSITSRNRRELCFFKTALGKKADIVHVVFDYKGNPDEPQPLSWHLTERQKGDIDIQIKETRISSRAKDVWEWYSKKLAGETAFQQEEILSKHCALDTSEN